MCTVNFSNEKLPLIESIKVSCSGKIVLDLAHCLKKKKHTFLQDHSSDSSNWKQFQFASET